MKNLFLIVKYVFRLEWYKVMILSAHVSGTDKTAISFSGVILNNWESSKIYLSANVCTFLIFVLEVGNLFCDKYRSMSLK